jgi:hypothetical protein
VAGNAVDASTTTLKAEKLAGDAQKNKMKMIKLVNQSIYLELMKKD